MLYWVTVTPYSYSFFTYLFISCPFSSIPRGPGCFHVCAGQWSSPKALSHLEINFSLPLLSWLWVPTVQALWDNGSFPMSVRMFILCMCRPLSPGINWIVPSLPLKAQKASNSFLLHMVACNTNQLHLDTPCCKYGICSTPLHLWRSNGLMVAEALPALVTFFFCSATCLLHFCVEIPLAKPEQACNHHKFNLVSSPPDYAEVLVALLSWIAALQADNCLTWHTLFMLYSLLDFFSSVKANIYL